MTPADDKPEFDAASQDEPEIGPDWFDELTSDEQAEHLAAVDRGIADGDAGRTAPIEDVLAWVRSWGTEHELPQPRCK